MRNFWDKKKTRNLDFYKLKYKIQICILKMYKNTFVFCEMPNFATNYTET